eukprot:6004610-Pleurochrysis_carterae.AAC.1
MKNRPGFAPRVLLHAQTVGAKIARSQLISSRGGEGQGDNPTTRRPLGAARPSLERVANAHQALACVVEAKKADTRTASSLTSDRKPSTQGESNGSMPEPSEKGRDKESRPESSGC